MMIYKAVCTANKKNGPLWEESTRNLWILLIKGNLIFEVYRKYLKLHAIYIGSAVGVPPLTGPQFINIKLKKMQFKIMLF